MPWAANAPSSCLRPSARYLGYMRHALEHRNKGVTLLEVTIVLVTLGILAAVLTPTVSGAIKKSKVQRARMDVIAIKNAMINQLTDTNARGIVHDGTKPRAEQEAVDLLVGDGDIPQLGSDVSHSWVQRVDHHTVDVIENHLSRNRPGSDPDHGYSNWYGAYMAAPIHSDPWGNRYMINTRYLFSGFKYDVVVLSAGPDEEVDSRFTQDGFVPGDDDIICLISSGTAGTKVSH